MIVKIITSAHRLWIYQVCKMSTFNMIRGSIHILIAKYLIRR